MIIGTCHFESLFAAVQYYKCYGFSPTDVSKKVQEGEITIVLPELRAGVTCWTNSEGRYFINDNK